MFGRKRRRREQVREKTFPAEWHNSLLQNVPYYRALPPQDQAEIQGHIQVLMDEKNFEGCGGMILTDEIKMLISAYAAILILHRNTGYYPSLVTILVYPSAFVVETSFQGPGTLELEGEEVHLGEAWQRGVVILAWDTVRRSFKPNRDPRVSGYNVPLHEFAHQLDLENGTADGLPCLEDPELRARWPEVFNAEFQRLTDDLDHNRPTLIDEYGEEDPAEFFAVVTELFFERPAALKRRHPDLYDVLQKYYRQDPAAILARPQSNEYSSAGVPPAD